MRPIHSFLIPLLVALASAAGAQGSAGLSIEASGLYGPLGGSGLSGIGSGVGLEIQGRFRLPAPVWSIGAGYELMYHSLEGGGGQTLRGLFLEPRRIIDVQSDAIFPYLGGRIALIRQHFSQNGIEGSADGSMLHIGAGLLIALNHRTLIDLGVMAGYASLGDYGAVGRTEGTAQVFEGSSGINVIARIGFSFTPGGG